MSTAINLINYFLLSLMVVNFLQLPASIVNYQDCRFRCFFVFTQLECHFSVTRHGNDKKRAKVVSGAYLNFYGFQKVAFREPSCSKGLIGVKEQTSFRVYICGEGEKMLLSSPAFLLILAFHVWVQTCV